MLFSLSDFDLFPSHIFFIDFAGKFEEETTQPTVDVEGNEIDGELDSTFISVESKAAAKKYGYKILLKKVGGHEVPVGKIKFTIPTIIEVDDEDIMEGGSGDEAEQLTTISPFREIIEERKTSLR